MPMLRDLIIPAFQFLALWPSLVWATTAQSVTVDEVIAKAFVQNSEVAYAKLQNEVAQARLESADSKFKPKVSLSVSEFNQDGPSTSSGLSGQMPQRSSTGTTAKASQQMNLFNGFRDLKRSEQRQAELHKSSYDLNATELAQRDRIIVSIFKILALQSDIENLNQKIRIEEERLQDIQRRVNSQSSRRSDLISVQSSLLTSQNDLQVAQSDLAIEWNALSQIAGKEMDQTFIALPSTPLNPFLAKIDLERLPDVKSAQFDQRAADLNLQLAQGAYWPSVEVVGNNYFKRPSAQEDVRWDWQLNVNLNIPIDGERSAQVKEARTAKLQKEIQAQNKIQQKRREIERMILQYNSDLERVKILQLSVKSQESLVVALRKDYQAGLSGMSEYLTALTSLLQKSQQSDRLKILQHQRFMQIKNILQVSGVSK